MIVAPALTVLIMALHPTGQDLTENFARGAAVNQLVHGTAIVAVPLVFLGLFALSRRLGHPDTAIAGLVAYGVAVVAWLLAGVASGFIQTELFGAMREAGEAETATLQSLSHFTYSFNQSFAAVGVLASGLAIGLLSLGGLRTHRMPKALAWFGLIVGVGLLLVQAGGFLDLDVRGFGLVILVQSAWFIGCGICLLQGKPAGSEN